MVTGLADVENLLLYATYIKNEKVEDIFCLSSLLSMLLQMDICTLFLRELENLGLSQWLCSIQPVGIDTDGAANMIGVEDGFVQKVRQNLSFYKCLLLCP